MGTINAAFSVISQALDADQAALNVVANNVANANTPGYTTENPNFQENQPLEIGGLSYGDGVTETGTTSVRDRVLNLASERSVSHCPGRQLPSNRAESPHRPEFREEVRRACRTSICPL